MENLIDFQRREKVISQKLQFINMASHEFRPPLSTIVSSVNLLDKYQQNNDRSGTSKHIQRLKDTVSGMRNMLEYFMAMNFSDSIENGTQCLSAEKFRQTILLSLHELEDGLKPGQDIKLSVIGSASVEVNQYYLISMIKNLVSNAIRFSAEHQAINVNLSIKTDSITLIVKDKGIGISPAQILQINKKYFTGPQLKPVPGSGLGLYIVARYLEALNGQIEIKSKPLEGSVFVITVPNRLQ